VRATICAVGDVSGAHLNDGSRSLAVAAPGGRGSPTRHTSPKPALAVVVCACVHEGRCCGSGSGECES